MNNHNQTPAKASTKYSTTSTAAVGEQRTRDEVISHLWDQMETSGISEEEYYRWIQLCNDRTRQENEDYMMNARLNANTKARVAQEDAYKRSIEEANSVDHWSNRNSHNS